MIYEVAMRAQKLPGNLTLPVLEDLHVYFMKWLDYQLLQKIGFSGHRISFIPLKCSKLISAVGADNIRFPLLICWGGRSEVMLHEVSHGLHFDIGKRISFMLRSYCDYCPRIIVVYASWYMEINISYFLAIFTKQSLPWAMSLGLVCRPQLFDMGIHSQFTQAQKIKAKLCKSRRHPGFMILRCGRLLLCP